MVFPSEMNEIVAKRHITSSLFTITYYLVRR